MVSTYTPNINLEEPARGDYVGTWDTPVNANMTLLDSVVGQITTISLNNSPVVLSAAQFQSRMLIFNSTLTGSVTITFPSTFKKDYNIIHNCTGSSAFTITLQTTGAGGERICPPPGVVVSVINDGANVFFASLERVGTFWDYAGSSVPNWVSACSKPPYLNCDGSLFSSATYPFLAGVLGGTTLPDSRGRVRAALNQASNRLLSSYGGLDGNTNLTGGGQDNVVLASSQIPANIPNTATTTFPGVQYIGTGFDNLSGPGARDAPTSHAAPTANTSVVINPTGGSFHSNVQPTYIGGLMMIRAA